jgi:transcriptional regulator with XRE-family HTH domain
MSFLAERDMAQAALAFQGTDHRPAFPPVAERIRDARQALGLSLEEFAQSHGSQPAQQYELELHDSALFEVIGLAALPGFAEALGLPVFTLLFGEQPMRAIRHVTYPEVVEAVERQTGEKGAVALSETVGCDLQPVLDDPCRLGGLSLKELFDLCRAIGVDWLGVLAATGQ